MVYQRHCVNQNVLPYVKFKRKLQFSAIFCALFSYECFQLLCKGGWESITSTLAVVRVKLMRCEQKRQKPREFNNPINCCKSKHWISLGLLDACSHLHIYTLLRQYVIGPREKCCKTGKVETGDLLLSFKTKTHTITSVVSLLFALCDSILTLERKIR